MTTEINNNTIASVPQLDSYSGMGFVPIESKLQNKSKNMKVK